MSHVDHGHPQDDGHKQSPIWVSDRPDQSSARPSPRIPSFAPVERVSLRSLLHERKYLPLRHRAIIAVVAGVLTGILFADWRAGVTGAVLAAIGHTVYCARSTSSVPAWRRPSVAERRTEAQLKKLERIGYRTLHARAIPGSEAQIDHLVIGPTGVYAVDSEKWDKRLPVRVQSGKKLFHGPFDRKDRLKEAAWEASQAASLIGKQIGREINVVPSLAIYGPAIPWKVLNIRQVDVFEGSRVRKWITKRERSLTDEEIEEIYQAAAQALPPRYAEG